MGGQGIGRRQFRHLQPRRGAPRRQLHSGYGGDDISIDDFTAMGRSVLIAAETGRLEREVTFIEHAAPPSVKLLNMDFSKPV